MKKELFIYLLSLSFVFSSCTKQEDETETSEYSEYPKTYAFIEMQKVEDFTCYVGSDLAGKKLLTPLKTPKDIWGSRLEVNPDQIVLIDESKLEKRNEFSSIPYTYKLSHDSLYILNAAKVWDFAAELKLEKLIYHLGFERYTKATDGVWQSGIGQSVRLINYKNMFGSIFNSPIEMTNVKDTMAWCNVYYEYSQRK